MKRRLDAEQALSYGTHSARPWRIRCSPDFAHATSGKIIYVNPAFCRMTGCSATELIGLLPPMPYWAPEEHENTLAVLESDGRVGTQRRRRSQTAAQNGERFDALIL
ncbi:MAG: PAS domain-containing protein [Betaproteobacteria bacterium]|nr:PAS domain-containing protein [Betaproteobacteria bacterium]